VMTANFLGGGQLRIRHWERLIWFASEAPCQNPHPHPDLPPVTEPRPSLLAIWSL